MHCRGLFVPAMAVCLVAAWLIFPVSTSAGTEPAVGEDTHSPNPSATSNVLNGVSEIAADDVWAVGDYVDDETGATKTLTLHWEGTRWSQVLAPAPGCTRTS
jgi:hypothetical protein